MYESFYYRKNQYWRKLLCGFMAFTFSVSMITVPASRANAQYISNLPAPGTMVLPSAAFEPAVLKGMTLHPENPLRFDFIVDRGQDKLSGDVLKAETQRLLKYFLASMTTPDDDSWVNLSPYEGNRIIPDKLAVTEMGKTMLEQDYLLKQLSSSMTNPQEALGKKFWDRVYQKAYEKFGTTSIPISTFNKVWIMPDSATIFEEQGYVFIGDSHLKVMLDEDYTSIKENLKNEKFNNKNLSPDKVTDLNNVSSQVVREIIIPELEKEVNYGKNFAPARQIYNSVILATWYKQNLKNSLLGKVYVDKGKIGGVEIPEKDVKQKVYDQYLAAFRKGVYNLIKEDYDLATKENLPRKYFSGGLQFKMDLKNVQHLDPRNSSSSAILAKVKASADQGRYFSSDAVMEEQAASTEIAKASSSSAVNKEIPAVERQNASEQAARILSAAGYSSTNQAMLGAAATLYLELQYLWNDETVAGTRAAQVYQKYELTGESTPSSTNEEVSAQKIAGNKQSLDRFISVVNGRVSGKIMSPDNAYLELKRSRSLSYSAVGASSSSGVKIYTIAGLEKKVMAVVNDKFKTPLARQVLGNLIQDLVDQATNSSVQGLYKKIKDYEHDRVATEEFINWIINDVGPRLDAKILAGKINPKKADWMTFDNRHKGLLPDNASKEEVKITVFATSGNPVQIAHIGQILNDLAGDEKDIDSGSDFALIVLQGTDLRKPDLTSMEVRSEILENSLLRSLSPLLKLSYINEDNQGVDGEENILRLSEMNKGLTINFRYLVGQDHILRTTWLRKGLPALPEIYNQKDTLRAILRISDRFLTPDGKPNEEVINGITDAMVRLANQPEAIAIFATPNNLVSAMRNRDSEGKLAGVYAILEKNFDEIFNGRSSGDIVALLNGKVGLTAVEYLLKRSDEITRNERIAITKAMENLEPYAFSSLETFKEALLSNGLSEEIAYKIANKKLLERLFNAIPILDTIARFENAVAGEVTIKGQSEPYQFVSGHSFTVVALPRDGETNPLEVQGVNEGNVRLVKSIPVPGFAAAAATGIRTNGNWLWTTYGILMAISQHVHDTKVELYGIDSGRAGEPQLKLHDLQVELIQRIAKGQVRFSTQSVSDEKEISTDDIEKVFQNIGLVQDKGDSDVWVVLNTSASSAIIGDADYVSAAHKVIDALKLKLEAKEQQKALILSILLLRKSFERGEDQVNPEVSQQQFSTLWNAYLAGVEGIEAINSPSFATYIVPVFPALGISEKKLATATLGGKIFELSQSFVTELNQGLAELRTLQKEKESKSVVAAYLRLPVFEKVLTRFEMENNKPLDKKTHALAMGFLVLLSERRSLNTKGLIDTSRISKAEMQELRANWLPEESDAFDTLLNYFGIVEQNGYYTVPKSLSGDYTNAGDSLEGVLRLLEEVRANSGASMATGANASSSVSNVGGIDFDPSLLHLQIKRNGHGIPLPIQNQNIENINIDGLYPVIINMQPATIQNLPFLLSSLPAGKNS